LSASRTGRFRQKFWRVTWVAEISGTYRENLRTVFPKLPYMKVTFGIKWSDFGEESASWHLVSGLG